MAEADEPEPQPGCSGFANASEPFDFGENMIAQLPAYFSHNHMQILIDQLVCLESANPEMGEAKTDSFRTYLKECRIEINGQQLAELDISHAVSTYLWMAMQPQRLTVLTSVHLLQSLLLDTNTIIDWHPDFPVEDYDNTFNTVDYRIYRAFRDENIYKYKYCQLPTYEQRVKQLKKDMRGLPKAERKRLEGVAETTVRQFFDDHPELEHHRLKLKSAKPNQFAKTDNNNVNNNNININEVSAFECFWAAKEEKYLARGVSGEELPTKMVRRFDKLSEERLATFQQQADLINNPIEIQPSTSQNQNQQKSTALAEVNNIGVDGKRRMDQYPKEAEKRLQMCAPLAYWIDIHSNTHLAANKPKNLADGWRALTAEDKQKYKEQAEQIRTEAKRQLRQFFSDHPQMKEQMCSSQIRLFERAGHAILSDVTALDCYRSSHQSKYQAKGLSGEELQAKVVRHFEKLSEEKLAFYKQQAFLYNHSAATSRKRNRHESTAEIALPRKRPLDWKGKGMRLDLITIFDAAV